MKVDSILRTTVYLPWSTETKGRKPRRTNMLSRIILRPKDIRYDLLEA